MLCKQSATGVKMVIPSDSAGMCLRIFMPQNYGPCGSPSTTAKCAGGGTHPYIKYITASWAWGGKVKYDTAEKLYYLCASLSPEPSLVMFLAVRLRY